MAHRTATKAARMVKQLNAVKPPKGRFKRPSAPASATPPEAGGPPPPERPVYATPESRVTQLLGAAKALEGTAHRAAKQLYAKALALAPGDGDALVRLAALHAADRQSDRAVSLLLQALDASPLVDASRRALIVGRLAKQLCADGQLRSAQLFLESALADHDSADLRIRLGEVMWLQKEVDAAREAAAAVAATSGRHDALARVRARVLGVEMATLMQREALPAAADALALTLADTPMRRAVVDAWDTLAHGHLVLAEARLVAGDARAAKAALRRCQKLVAADSPLDGVYRSRGIALRADLLAGVADTPVASEARVAAVRGIYERLDDCETLLEHQFHARTQCLHDMAVEFALASQFDKALPMWRALQAKLDRLRVGQLDVDFASVSVARAVWIAEWWQSGGSNMTQWYHAPYVTAQNPLVAEQFSRRNTADVEMLRSLRNPSELGRVLAREALWLPSTLFKY